MEKVQVVYLEPDALVSFSMFDSAHVLGEMAALLTCNNDYPYQSIKTTLGALFNPSLAVNLTVTGLMHGNEFLDSPKGEP
jgi:hypothetical protein